jgi:uncharacterized protein (TIGR03435 family)
MNSFAKPIHIGCFVCLSVGMLFSQTGSIGGAGGGSLRRPLEFEVATIKPTNPNIPGMAGPKVYPNGRVVIGRTTFEGLIALAFGLDYRQISGDEKWMTDTSYDIEAIPPEQLSAQTLDLRYTNWAIEDEHLRQMLQALLVDPFQLKFHREQRPETVYFLERSGKRLRLQPSKASSKSENGSEPTGYSGDVGFAGGRWVLFNASMPQIARFATMVLQIPIIDRTNLSGSFDYRQPAALSDDEANYKDPSDSFRLLIGELGLSLKPSRGTVEAFVIDHAEKPSPN